MISIKVLIDLVPFLIVLFGQNLVFAVIFKAMEFEGENFVEDEDTYVHFTNII